MIPFGEGELIGDAPHRRVEILSDDETLHATWSRWGARRIGADLHVHRRHTDVFYVLEGELTIRLGNDGHEVLVPAGTLARVPRGVVHGFRNGSDGDVLYLNFHAPGRQFAEYLRALRDGRRLSYDQHPPPADGGRPTSEAVVGAAELVAERPGLRVELLADAEELAVAETRGQPGEPSARPHLHRRHVESLYVLDGELALTADGRELRAPAGTWVQVPPGVPHALAPAGPGETRCLSLHTPSRGYGAFLRCLHEVGTEEEAAARTGFDQEPA